MENLFGKFEALSKIKGENRRGQRKEFLYQLYRTYERMVNFSEDGKYYSGFSRPIHEDKECPFDNGAWVEYIYWDLYGKAG